MIKTLHAVTILILIAIVACGASSSGTFSGGTNTGGKIVIIGDSITAGTVDGGGWVKRMGKGYVNAGESSNTSTDARNRFVADVMDERPDSVVIELGVAHVALSAGIGTFETDVQWMIDTAQDGGVEPILMTTTPRRDGSGILDSVNASISYLATSNSLVLIDFYNSAAATSIQNETDMYDLWHPSTTGYQKMYDWIMFTDQQIGRLY